MFKKNCYLCLYLLSLFAVSPLYVSAQVLAQFENSKQRYVYDVFYKKIAIGKIIRKLDQQGKTVIANSTAKLSFLYYRFGGDQLSHLYWDAPSQLFLCKKFELNSKGFSRVRMQADFYHAGHKTIVTGNGKRKEFVNETEKIVDFNAVGVQLSAGLKAGQRNFDFYMQTSDSVEHYFFKVSKEEVIKTKFGKFATYLIQQTGKNDRQLSAWFAPDINYQMVKFYYKRKLLEISGVLSEYSINTAPENNDSAILK